MGLVEVPSNVGLDAVETAVGELADGGVPGARLLPEVVDGAGDVLEWLTIHLEFVSNDLE